MAVDVLKTKVCTKCEKEKVLGEFHKDSYQRDNLSCRCKKCKAEDNAKRYRSEEERKRLKAYYKRKDIQAKYHFAAVERKYGITRDQYEEMLDAQGGVCAFCGKTPSENKKRLAVDHDHTLRRVRWLLCGDCNTGIGLFHEDSAVLRRAADFLDAEIYKGLIHE